MKPRTIRMPAELWAKLETLAARERRSLNAQVVFIVERGVAAAEQERSGEGGREERSTTR